MPTGVSTFIQDAQNNVAAVAPLGQIYTNEAFPILIASYHQSMTGASGGTNLPNVPCGKVELQNLSGNGVMWVGSVGQSAPYSGRGFELFGMDTVAGANGKTMYVNNANQISVCAFHSGQLISFICYGNAVSTVISPTTQGTAPNITPPVLSGTTPVSGSIDNPQHTPIIFTFNEPLDPSNISGIYIVGSGQASPQILGHLGGVLTYFSGSTVATFQPNSGQLQLSGWYIPMVDPSVHGFNGIPISGSPGITESGSPFQVQGPPIVSGFSYASGLTGTSGQPFNIIFSEPMLSGTVNISGIYVLATGTASPNLSGTVSLLSTNSGTQAAFQFFSGALAVSTTYIPFVNTNVKDQFGNAIPALTSGSPFTTAAVFGPDTTPPKVSGTNPVSGATGVLVIPTVQIIMSKSVNTTFVNATTVKIHDIQVGDTNVAGTASLQSDLITVSWTPNAIMANSHLHRMEISGIQDLAGNKMTPFSGATFTIEPILQVSGTTPAAGDSSIDVTAVMQMTMDRPVLSGTVNTSTCKLVDQNGNNITINSVSLTSDNLTVAFKPLSLGYLAPYTYEVSGIIDINNQQFMFPFSGATFNTIAPALTQVYSVTGGNAQPLFPGNSNQAGSDILGETPTSNNSPLFNKLIKQAVFSLQAVGSPTGTITATVRDANHNIQTTLGTMQATALTTTQADYTFTNLSASYTLVTNSSINIEFSNYTSNNYVNAFSTNNNAYTSTTAIAHIQTQPGGGLTWQIENGSDMVASFWY